MDIKPSDLGLLMALDALLDVRNVTRAAEHLGLSQPAMSAQLARLRQIFNDPLLTPSGRRLVPTARAEELREPLRHALAAIDTLVREGRNFDAATTTRCFSLIASDYVQSAMAKPLIAQLQELAPGARLKFLPFDRATLWQSLESGQADLSMSTAMVAPDALTRAGFTEDFVVIRRHGHPDMSENWGVDIFCRTKHIVVPWSDGSLGCMTDAKLEEMGRRREVIASFSCHLAALSTVIESDMICVMPRRLVTCGDMVEILEMPFPSTQFSTNLLWHPRQQNDPALIWFRSVVSDVAKTV